MNTDLIKTSERATEVFQRAGEAMHDSAKALYEMASRAYRDAGQPYGESDGAMMRWWHERIQEKEKVDA